MPKVIENPQERILACARAMLLEQGIAHLNIRAVAAACGMAVGTVYNYYRSKDQLIASIMLEDWLLCMREAAGDAAAACTPADGLRAICRGIARFAGRYRTLWLHSVQAPDRSYHARLIEQLSVLVQALIAHFDLTDNEAAPGFAAENLLRLALAEPERYEKEEALLLRALQK